MLDRMEAKLTLLIWMAAANVVLTIGGFALVLGQLILMGHG
jgi:hypothetical protein